LIQSLENAISNIFVPALTDHECTQLERDILALPVRNGGLGIPNPCHEATKEHAASIQVTGPLVRQIESQMQELPD
jgi:glycerate kinase